MCGVNKRIQPTNNLNHHIVITSTIWYHTQHVVCAQCCAERCMLHLPLECHEMRRVHVDVMVVEYEERDGHSDSF